MLSYDIEQVSDNKYIFLVYIKDKKIQKEFTLSQNQTYRVCHTASNYVEHLKGVFIYPDKAIYKDKTIDVIPIGLDRHHAGQKVHLYEHLNLDGYFDWMAAISSIQNPNVHFLNLDILESDAKYERILTIDIYTGDWK